MRAVLEAPNSLAEGLAALKVKYETPPGGQNLVADMRWPVKCLEPGWPGMSVIGRQRAGTWRRRSTTLISADQDRTSLLDRRLPLTNKGHRGVYSCHEDLPGLVAHPLSPGHHVPDETGQIPGAGHHRVVLP